MWSYLRLNLVELLRAVAGIGVRTVPDSAGFCIVTGCGHSGTTMLASKPGLHPQVLLIYGESSNFSPQRDLRLAA